MAQLIAWIGPWVPSIQVAYLSLKHAASLCRRHRTGPRSAARAGTARGRCSLSDRGSGRKRGVFPGGWETCHGVNLGRIQPQDIEFGLDRRFHFEEL